MDGDDRKQVREKGGCAKLEKMEMETGRQRRDGICVRKTNDGREKKKREKRGGVAD